MKFLFLIEFSLILKGCFLLDCVRKQFSLICIESDLITFPKSNFNNKDVAILDLSKNNIRILYEDALDDFENLLNLTLDSNKIWKITNNAFKNQFKLKYLSLRNNALIISNNTFLSSVFRYLVRLEYLDLSSNPLGIIPENFFLDLRNLRELFLEEMMKEIRIKKGALSNLFNLKLLSLAKNNFISLPNYFEYEFQEMQLETLLLHDNPWTCDCRMRWFKRWLITMNQNNENLHSNIENVLQNIHPMVCETPKYLQGRKLCDQPLSKFECEPKTLRLGKTLVIKHLENVTLSCQFESYPKSYVKWFKNGILIQDHWDRIKLSQSSGRNFIANLTIFSSKFGIDDGCYVCETTNNVGSARSNYTLIIKIPSYKDNLIENKKQQTILLLIIVASGIITLIILVGIVIYCFYGNSSNIENQFMTLKKSDLLYANDKVLMTCNSDLISTSPLLKIISKNDTHNDLLKWNNRLSVDAKDPERKKLNINSFVDKADSNENPIVKNFMVNESIFSNHTSDSDNHSCQLSIHEDCPIHGTGNSFSCPIHDSENEVTELENQSYNWSYVFNNKNTIANNYYSLKSAFNSNNGCNINSSMTDSYSMNIKKSDTEKNDCALSIDNVIGQRSFTIDQI